jgi:hypothetical protein
VKFAHRVSFAVRVYMAEVMPMQIRGKGNAFAVGIGNWAVSTLWNQISPVALGKLQWKFYFVFVAWSELPPSVNFMDVLLTHQTSAYLFLSFISSSRKRSRNHSRRLTCYLVDGRVRCMRMVSVSLAQNGIYNSLTRQRWVYLQLT